MIPIPLKSLKELEIIEELEVLSVEISLYIVRLLVNGQIYRVIEEDDTIAKYSKLGPEISSKYDWKDSAKGR